MQTRDKNRQKRDENEHVFPKDNYPRIEQLVERDAPRAFRAPERSSEADEPRTISCALCCALWHFESVYPGDGFRQFRTSTAHFSRKSDATTYRTPKALRAKSTKTSAHCPPALEVRTCRRVAFCLRPILNGKEIKEALTPQLMVCYLAAQHYALPQVRVS